MGRTNKKKRIRKNKPHDVNRSTPIHKRKDLINDSWDEFLKTKK